jgi:hypothetical protein
LNNFFNQDSQIILYDTRLFQRRQIMKKFLVFLFALMITIGSFSNVSATPTAAVEWTSYNWDQNMVNCTMGYSFSVKSDIWVTHLGAFDYQSDGLNSYHDVGIFATTGTLLVSDTVSAGTADPLIGHFRYSELNTAFELTAGNYIIAATRYGHSYGDNYGYNAQGFFTAPEVNYIESRFSYTPESLTMPTNTNAGLYYGVFGGNFMYETVPEPATMLLLGLGLMGLAGAKRKF